MRPDYPASPWCVLSGTEGDGFASVKWRRITFSDYWLEKNAFRMLDSSVVYYMLATNFFAFEQAAKQTAVRLYARID